MYTHYITEIKKMQPRSNQNFSTTYYNATDSSNKALLAFINVIFKKMENDLKFDLEFTQSFYLTELGKQHKKKDKSIYVVGEVIIDLHDQIYTGKNATESMIDRWNKIPWSDTHQIEVTVGTASAQYLPKHLFEF